MRAPYLKHGLKGIAALVVALVFSNVASAAVSQGPKYTNAVVAEQQRILQFYQAEQSFQQKLKVGRERYEQKQVARAKVIAAMSAALQDRQQDVVLPPAEVTSDHAAESDSASRPWLGVVILASCMIGFGYYLKSQRLTSSG